MNKRQAKKKYKAFMEDYAAKKLYLVFKTKEEQRKFAAYWSWLRVNFREVKG